MGNVQKYSNDMCSKGVWVQQYRKEKERRVPGGMKLEAIKEMVRERRRLIEVYITDRNERNRKEYGQKNQEVKMITRQNTYSAFNN